MFLADVVIRLQACASSETRDQNMKDILLKRSRVNLKCIKAKKKISVSCASP
jgi:hypothetical protein